MRVIVADNEDAPVARSVVESFRARLDIHYVHAPANNISVARNACLTAAQAPWIAFIDDDEVVAHDWLERLFEIAHDADIVFGPARSIYGDCPPRWIERCDFHSNSMEDETSPSTGYTSNVLIRRQFLLDQALQFDVALGVSGGEDTDLFFRARLCGARIASAPHAAVFEDVPSERQTIGWLAKRRIRSGQSHARALSSARALTIPWRAMTALKAAYCLTLALIAAPFSSTTAARATWRGLLHMGALGFTRRSSLLEEYAQSRGT